MSTPVASWRREFSVWKNVLRAKTQNVTENRWWWSWWSNMIKNYTYRRNLLQIELTTNQSLLVNYTHTLYGRHYTIKYTNAALSKYPKTAICNFLYARINHLSLLNSLKFTINVNRSVYSSRQSVYIVFFKDITTYMNVFNWFLLYTEFVTRIRVLRCKTCKSNGGRYSTESSF